MKAQLTRHPTQLRMRNHHAGYWVSITLIFFFTFVVIDNIYYITHELLNYLTRRCATPFSTLN
ncbi:Protein of unknown function [Pyronema omphalodes CBS 100304]|uniref:Uncharacterized protein n=1 Tax=Pyronema omphalodes (strain CBS 100304) TaxID=1076935 RepID=U4KWJ7_PYROM|nr:Protein of unknown function [Pyronema omphalodes CBS 100304]